MTMRDPHPYARSLNACWTCKLRHRKCDEVKPACRECSIRSIPCHGYNQPPDWIEDSARAQYELEKLKSAIKQDARRARRARLEAETSFVHRAPLPSSPSPKKLTPHWEGASHDPLRDAELLMHYLDYIVPVVYHYRDTRYEAGTRGWLFWLLSKEGPLRQAAFTLSALHQYMLSGCSSESQEAELLRYHGKAMHELRKAVNRSQAFDAASEACVELLACGTALISFQVFRGGTHSWLPHLNALSYIVKQIPVSEVAFSDTAPTLGIAMKFLIAAVLHYDILACLATGQAPKTNYREWLTSDMVDLSSIMGCHNWVMLAIGDLAQLAIGTNDSFMDKEAAYLEDSLQDELRALDVSLSRPLSVAVSRVFASAALLQVRVLRARNGCIQLSDRANLVQDVIDAINMMPVGMTLRGLAWPICVAGCLAMDQQQIYFKNLMNDIIGAGVSGFTNCSTVYQIMEGCWARQRDANSWDLKWDAATTMADMCVPALLV